MKHLALPLSLFALVFFGAGCISFSGGGDTGPKLGVWKSVDGGQKWELATKLPTPQGVGSITTVSARELVIDPSDRFALYLGTDEHGMFYSYDGASGWMQVREPNLKEGRVRSIAVSPNDKCTVYASRGQRLYKSEDCSRTFNSEAYVDNRGTVLLSDVEVDWFNPDVVYLTTSEGEVLKSSDQAKTWATVYRSKSHIRDLHIDATDSRIILITTARQGIHRSTDSGASWSKVLEEDSELKELVHIKRTTHLEQDASSNYTWATSDYGLLLSRDKGATWAVVPLVTPPDSIKISALAVNPRNGAQIMYASGQTIYKSENAGADWDTEKVPATGEVFELLIDPIDSNTVYLGAKAVEDEGMF
jgi:photosystem II stability/assembly factor-like uncharacterized protein